MTKWAVFGEFNVYTGCDDLLGHVDANGDDYEAAAEALTKAREQFPHNAISHVNGPKSIMHSAGTENALWEFHQQERQCKNRQHSTSPDEAMPAVSVTRSQGNQKVHGLGVVIILFVIVALVWAATHL